jgi:hypothetical protein
MSFFRVRIAFAVGLLALGHAADARADKSDWTKLEKEWGELYEQAWYR